MYEPKNELFIAAATQFQHLLPHPPHSVLNQAMSLCIFLKNHAIQWIEETVGRSQRENNLLNLRVRQSTILTLITSHCWTIGTEEL